MKTVIITGVAKALAMELLNQLLKKAGMWPSPAAHKVRWMKQSEDYRKSGKIM